MLTRFVGHPEYSDLYSISSHCCLWWQPPFPSKKCFQYILSALQYSEKGMSHKDEPNALNINRAVPSLTGRPNVAPERAALTASVEPRRGAPESKEKWHDTNK
jgi:hypothetical protein